MRIFIRKFVCPDIPNHAQIEITSSVTRSQHDASYLQLRRGSWDLKLRWQVMIDQAKMYTSLELEWCMFKLRKSKCELETGILTHWTGNSNSLSREFLVSTWRKRFILWPPHLSFFFSFRLSGWLTICCWNEIFMRSGGRILRRRCTAMAGIENL